MSFTLNLEKTMSRLQKGAFLTVKSGEKTNTMTIGWGYIGIMWNKPFFMVMVRPGRYTNELLENSDNFTVSVPFENNLNKELGICGVKSGRDINKGEIVEFIPSKSVESPIIKGCNMHYECKIKYIQKMDGEAFPKDMEEKWYPEKDYHFLYYGEIIEAYETSV
ncbi:MAG: flavin reductase family protein [Sebaldella sp.]|nr:flavin reductase family protein [Sebaldella sp.]